MHAPSLGVPPVRDRPLVVTVHDVAFLRLPARHDEARRQLPHARPHARAPARDAWSIVPSEFTGRELEREGFARDRIAVVPFGVDPPAPRDPDEIDRAVAQRGRPTAVRPHRRHRRTAQGPRHHRARRRPAAPHPSRPDAGRRRPARVGRGARARSAVRARHRRAAVVDARRALPPRRRVLPRVAVRGVRPPGVEAMARGVPTIAHHRLRARGDRAGRGRPVRPRRRRRAARSRSNACSTTTRCAPSSRAPVSPAPPSSAGARCAEGHRARVRSSADRPRAVFVDSPRARAARRLRRPRPPGRRRRLHDRDRARHVGARRHRPAPPDPARRHRALARDRAGRRPCTRSRRTAARPAWRGSRSPGPRVARRIRPDVWHGPHYTMPLRSTRADGRRDARPHVLRPPRMARAFEGRLLPPHDRRGRAPRRRRSSPGATTRPTGCEARFRSAGRDRRRSTTASTTRASRPRPTSTTRPTTPLLARHGIARPYIAFASTIEPRKDVPVARARVRPHRRRRTPTSSSSSPAATAGVSTRPAPRSRRAASRRASCGPGYVDDATLAALFRRAEVIAYPSLVEGFGMPALEALASGTPLVTTSGSALEEVVGDAALLVPPADADALARALATRARRSRASRPGSAPAGRPRAATFTWERSIDAHVDAYDRAIRHHARRRDRARMKALVTGATGFVGPHLLAHLRGVRRRRRDARRRERRVRHHRPRRGARGVRRAPTRGRVPPRGVVRRRRVVARSRPRACASTSKEPPTCSTPRARAARGASSSSAAPRSTARSTPDRPAARGRAAAADDAVRREQGRGLVPRAAGVARRRARDRPRARVLAHRSGPVRPLRRSRARAAHRRRRARRARDAIPIGARATRCATSPTCATSCARTGSSSSAASRARSTTSAAAPASSIGEIADRLVARRRRPRRLRGRPTRSSDRSRCPASSATRPSSSPRPAGRPQYSLDDTLDAVLADARTRAQGS